MLEIDKVTCSFGDVTAVKQANLTIQRGEMVGIIGRSGSGKSSLLRLINRLYTPQEGTIRWDGQTVSDLKGCELRAWRQRATIIFQDYNLIPRLDVLTNVLLGTLGRRPLAPVMFKQWPKELRAQAVLELDRLSMADTIFKRTQFLSGGQQQRIAIARAMLQEPEILLADEPVASLDPINAEIVMQSIADINASRGITVLVNLHSIDIARRYCRRVIGMNRGSIVFDGPVSELTESAVAEIYRKRTQPCECSGDAVAQVQPVMPAAAAVYA